MIESARTIARHARDWARVTPRRCSIAVRRVPTDRVRVFYGRDRLPAQHEHAIGGIVKCQHLAGRFPNSPQGFNTLYMVSSASPRGAEYIAKTAADKGVSFVWNQNGTATPASHGAGFDERNRPMAKLYHVADFVFYQSDFCRRSANHFLGERSGPGEVLFNPVDTDRFAPRDNTSDTPTLLLGGSQYQRYRFETAVATIAELQRIGEHVRLIVTGGLMWDPNIEACHADAHAISGRYGVTDRIELVGPYTQQDAPSIYTRAHALLHTKYNDPSPGLVGEALSCGLPIVYSASGGLPELVGEHAGIGIDAIQSFEEDHPPSPPALAEAALNILAKRDRYSEAARSRALDAFKVETFVERHADLFDSLRSEQNA